MEFGDMLIQELAGIKTFKIFILIQLKETTSQILFKMEWFLVFKEKMFMNIMYQLLHPVT
jgi:hypothetical protein